MYKRIKNGNIFLVLFLFITLYGVAQEKALPKYSDSLMDARKIVHQPDPWGRIFSLRTGKEFRYWGVTAAFIDGSEFELGASRFYCPWGILEVIDLSISNEFVPNASNFNPKVSASISWGFFAAKFSAIDYTTNFKTEIYMLRPEIGFSLLGLIEFFYGQDIQLNNFESRNIRPFGWTIEANIPFARKGSLPLGF